MGSESDCHSLLQRCMQMQLQLSCLDSNGFTHSTSAAAAASTTATIPTQLDEYDEADDTVQSAIAAAESTSNY